MKIEEISRILIVGSGTIGRQIGLQCAMKGYDVVLYDVNQDIVESAIKQEKAYAAQLVSEERISQEQAEASLARITITTNPEEAAAEADIISESVPENPDLKRKVFNQFNKLCPSHTIFTTNTSTLIPSMIAEGTGRPKKFLALHFHQIVWQSNIVDIMPHRGTSRETIELVHDFARRIGQIPIYLKKESPFYVFNAMYFAFTRAAINLVRNDIASIEDIDRSWMGVTKMEIGPFGMMDAVGIDTALKIFKNWAKKSNDPELQATADILVDYVDKGNLGIKSGQGFYTYPNPDYQQPGFLESK